uniref:Uncharacterized protein n=1 Tax=Anguilla anguilla TaxID=7936 RepID=A0A0E9SZD8_ANGAN
MQLTALIMSRRWELHDTDFHRPHVN